MGDVAKLVSLIKN